jgi:hypothetical protein
MASLSQALRNGKRQRRPYFNAFGQLRHSVANKPDSKLIKVKVRPTDSGTWHMQAEASIIQLICCTIGAERGRAARGAPIT